MGCNCGKPKPKPTTPPTSGQTQSFALQMRDGSTMQFGSRLEAEAENVRRGYTGVIKPS